MEPLRQNLGCFLYGQAADMDAPRWSVAVSAGSIG
jgi:hypothetical protein